MNFNAYMSRCLELARKALELGEVPIGCVVTRKGEIIAEGYNTRNTMKNALCHAEITAIDAACRVSGDWRLEDCTLFVTVEPCPMCAGAIVQARIKTVVFGTRSFKAGCAGTILNVLDNPGFNHRASVLEGVMAEECAALMSDYFERMRAGRQRENIDRDALI